MGHRSYFTTNTNRPGAPSNRELKRRALKIIQRGDDLQRDMAQLYVERMHARVALIALLMQSHSGSATVTKGTLEQAQANYARMGYEVKPTEDGKEYIITVVEAPEAPADPPVVCGPEVAGAAEGVVVDGAGVPETEEVTQ